MQTFLPYPDFAKSARALDSQRLGKQRVEVKQLLIALGHRVGDHVAKPQSAWANHPAAKMWRNYEWALAQYGASICAEWVRRGYRDALQPQFCVVIRKINRPVLPDWLGWEAFHFSHQSNLVRKKPEFYRPLFPDVPDNLPYIWPTPELHAKLAMGYSTGINQLDTRH
jgi:hypothetical protein